MLSFVKIKSSRNGEVTLSFTDEGKSCHSREFFTSQICLFMPIRENKILAKISEFTVLSMDTTKYTREKLPGLLLILFRLETP